MKVRIVLTGLNGYGGNFIEPLLETDGTYELAAVVSRAPQKSPHFERLKERGVRIYPNLEDCLRAEKAEMAIITTPMHIHYREVMCALSHKLSVYCEKPLTATLEQCNRIADYAKEQGCIVAVGYQWSYSDAVAELKKQILQGTFGKLLRVKSLALWNRPKSYYTDSHWKGRLYGENGEAIWESVMSNGAAHFLHHVLFLAGEEWNRAAQPVQIEAKCYRAHKIESFDTACVKMKTENGCELLYLATMAAKRNCPAEFVAECEQARISYPVGEQKEIVAEFKDGRRMSFGSPEEGRFIHFRQVVTAIRENDTANEVQAVRGVPCDVETALPIATVIDYVMKHLEVQDFPKEKVCETEESIWVEDLEKMMRKWYDDFVIS